MTPHEFTERSTRIEDRTSVATIEAALRGEVPLLSATLPEAGDGSELRGYLRDLVSGPRFVYAVSAAAEHLRAVRGGRRGPSSSGRPFPGWFVAVTAYPWPEPSDVPRHLGGGYLSLLTAVTAPAYRPSEGCHVGHWVLFPGRDAPLVRLTLIPNHRTTGASLIVPRDLLSNDERELLGLSTDEAS